MALSSPAHLATGAFPPDLPTAWTSLRGPARSNWIIPGHLLQSATPNTLQDAVAIMKEAQVSAVVSLHPGLDAPSLLAATAAAAASTPSARAAQPYGARHALSTPDYMPTLSAAAGTVSMPAPRRVHVPILEAGGAVLPDERMASLALDVMAALKAGDVVMLLCDSGNGRSGTLAALLLGLTYGLTSQESLDAVERSRSQRAGVAGHVPETPQQRGQVHRLLGDARLRAAAAEVPPRALTPQDQDDDLQAVLHKLREGLGRLAPTALLHLRRHLGNEEYDALALHSALRKFHPSLYLSETETEVLASAAAGRGSNIIALLVGSVPPNRAAVMNAVFSKMDVQQRGEVALADLASLYKPEGHPWVLSGKRTAEAVRAEFVDTFGNGSGFGEPSSAADAARRGYVTASSWRSYYAHISAIVEDDPTFDMLLWRTWPVRGQGRHPDAPASATRVPDARPSASSPAPRRSKTVQDLRNAAAHISEWALGAVAASLKLSAPRANGKVGERMLEHAVQQFAGLMAGPDMSEMVRDVLHRAAEAAAAAGSDGRQSGGSMASPGVHAGYVPAATSGPDSQSVELDAVLQVLIPEMPAARRALVMAAWDKALSVAGDATGCVSAQWMAGAFAATKHPAVQAGRKTADAITRAWLSAAPLAVSDDERGAKVVRGPGWELLHAALSACVADDSMFQLIMWNCWGAATARVPGSRADLRATAGLGGAPPADACVPAPTFATDPYAGRGYRAPPVPTTAELQHRAGATDGIISHMERIDHRVREERKDRAAASPSARAPGAQRYVPQSPGGAAPGTPTSAVRSGSYWGSRAGMAIGPATASGVGRPHDKVLGHSVPLHAGQPVQHQQNGVAQRSDRSMEKMSSALPEGALRALDISNAHQVGPAVDREGGLLSLQFGRDHALPQQRVAFVQAGELGEVSRALAHRGSATAFALRNKLWQAAHGSADAPVPVEVAVAILLDLGLGCTREQYVRALQHLGAATHGAGVSPADIMAGLTAQRESPVRQDIYRTAWTSLVNLARPQDSEPVQPAMAMGASVPLGTVRALYDASAHPAVVAGTAGENAVQARFDATFVLPPAAGGSSPDAMVQFYDFAAWHAVAFLAEDDDRAVSAELWEVWHVARGMPEKRSAAGIVTSPKQQRSAPAEGTPPGQPAGGVHPGMRRTLAHSGVGLTSSEGHLGGSGAFVDRSGWGVERLGWTAAQSVASARKLDQVAEAATGEEVAAKVRKHLRLRGQWALVDVLRQCYEADRQCHAGTLTRTLPRLELADVLDRAGSPLTHGEQAVVMQEYNAAAVAAAAGGDTGHAPSAAIAYEALIWAIAGAVPAERQNVVVQAWQRLDRDGRGVLSDALLKSKVAVHLNPDVRRGRKSEARAASEVAGHFTALQNVEDGHSGRGGVTWNTFRDAFTCISPMVETDREFQAAVQGMWR